MPVSRSWELDVFVSAFRNKLGPPICATDEFLATGFLEV